MPYAPPAASGIKTQLLQRAPAYTAGAGTRQNHGIMHCIDAAPAVGTNTYEVYCACFGVATLTIQHSARPCPTSYASPFNQKGRSVWIAKVYTP